MIVLEVDENAVVERDKVLAVQWFHCYAKCDNCAGKFMKNSEKCRKNLVKITTTHRQPTYIYILDTPAAADWRY